MTEEIINSDGTRNWQANILQDQVKRLEEELKQANEDFSCIEKDYRLLNKQINALKQENKELKDNNNHLQAIIDDGRAENKRFREDNERLKECTNTAIIEQEKLLSQLNAVREENKELKKQIESQKGLITVGSKQQYDITMAYDKCKTALEEIRDYCDRIEQGSVIGTQDCLINSIKNITSEVLND